MQDSTEIVSNETGKDIEKKMSTMDTVPMGMEMEPNDKAFDDEAEAIAVYTDHTGEPQRWGKGIIADFKRTVGTNWVKEMTNFNQKTVAVSFFLYIAAIAPTITFGAVYGRSTNNYMGAIELMLATSWYGITYALAGGMPMVSKLMVFSPLHPSLFRFVSLNPRLSCSVSTEEQGPSSPFRQFVMGLHDPSMFPS